MMKIMLEVVRIMILSMLFMVIMCDKVMIFQIKKYLYM